MTLDQQNNRHLGSIGFDHLSYGNGPQFSNPWASASSNGQLFPSSLNSNNMGFDALAKQQTARGSCSLPYSSLPASAPSMNSSSYSTAPYTQPLMSLPQPDLLNQNRSSYDQAYSAAPSVNTFPPTSAPYTDSYGNVAQPQRPIDDRRLSQSYVLSSKFLGTQLIWLSGAPHLHSHILHILMRWTLVGGWLPSAKT